MTDNEIWIERNLPWNLQYLSTWYLKTTKVKGWSSHNRPPLSVSCLGPNFQARVRPEPRLCARSAPENPLLQTGFGGVGLCHNFTNLRVVWTTFVVMLGKVNDNEKKKNSAAFIKTAYFHHYWIFVPIHARIFWLNRNRAWLETGSIKPEKPDLISTSDVIVLRDQIFCKVKQDTQFCTPIYYKV